MEQRSIHGEVKAKVYRNILLNRTFTVIGLCAETRLRRDQVYPILAKLRKLGFLTVQSAPKNKKSAHRPDQLYTLSSELEKRKSLASEIAPFLQLSPATLSHSDGLTRVDLRLSEISQRIEENIHESSDTSIAYLHVYLQESEHALKELAGLKNDLEIAWYECNRSSQHSMHKEFKKTQKSFETLSKRVADLNCRLTLRLDELKAEERFSDIAKRSLGPGICTLRQAQDVLRAEYHENTEFFLRKILSAVCARVTFASDSSQRYFSRQRVGYALAEACVRFGSDSKLFSQWMDHLVSTPSSDELALYSLANTCLLSNSEERALDSWKQFIGRQSLVTTLGGLKELSVYRGATVYSGETAEIGRGQLEELENRLGLNGAVSMASTEPVELFGTGYVIKPTIPDWLEPQSDGFMISASFRTTQSNLFAYGPLAGIVHFPGLPRVRLATALVRVGVKVDAAWRLAEMLKGGKVVLVLHTPSAADSSTTGGIQDILPGFKQEGSFVAAAPETDSAAASAVA